MANEIFGLADGLLDSTPGHKIVRKIFTEKSGSFLVLQNFANFLKYQFLFGLYTYKARKLIVVESNQAKARLTKPWLATDEANRSPVV